MRRRIRRALKDKKKMLERKEVSNEGEESEKEDTKSLIGKI